jgi:hypothetical protein
MPYPDSNAFPRSLVEGNRDATNELRRTDASRLTAEGQQSLSQQWQAGAGKLWPVAFRLLSRGEAGHVVIVHDARPLRGFGLKTDDRALEARLTLEIISLTRRLNVCRGICFRLNPDSLSALQFFAGGDGSMSGDRTSLRCRRSASGF